MDVGVSITGGIDIHKPQGIGKGDLLTSFDLP